MLKAIFILGGMEDEKHLQLDAILSYIAQKNYSPQQYVILLNGISYSNDVSTKNKASTLSQYLQEKGVISQSIIEETNAKDILGNMYYCEEEISRLLTLNMRKDCEIVLVGSNYIKRRLKKLYSIVFNDFFKQFPRVKTKYLFVETPLSISFTRKRQLFLENQKLKQKLLFKGTINEDLETLPQFNTLTFREFVSIDTLLLDLWPFKKKRTKEIENYLFSLPPYTNNQRKNNQRSLYAQVLSYFFYNK